jgi:hypothetical protein
LVGHPASEIEGILVEDLMFADGFFFIEGAVLVDLGE